MTSTDKQSVAHRIWTFIASRGSVGVIADAVLAQFPELGHTTVTARMYGLKHAGLIARHPDRLVRKTRKGRQAEVWVVPPRTKFDAKKYREPKKKDKEPKGDLHSRLTEIVDSAFGPIPTAPTEKLLTILEERAEEMRIERVKENEESCDQAHVTDAEMEVLSAARTYGEMDADDKGTDAAINTLFDTICRVYPPRKVAR